MQVCSEDELQYSSDDFPYVLGFMVDDNFPWRLLTQRFKHVEANDSQIVAVLKLIVYLLLISLWDGLHERFFHCWALGMSTSLFLYILWDLIFAVVAGEGIPLAYIIDGAHEKLAGYVDLPLLPTVLHYWHSALD